MGFVFIKAFLIAPFRSNTISDDRIIKKTRIVLNNFQPDKQRIENYRTVCGFSKDRPRIIPITYLQTLFNSILGKFITSPGFPINPLGLIHIFQSFDQKRAVTTDERLDLACSLDSIRKTQTGIETVFHLDVLSQGKRVWQGTSVFLTRNRLKQKKTDAPKQDTWLEKKETIPVPANTGRKYARVSGDYNPHHLYPVLATLFGFKHAIAHGMWSLARVVASLDRVFGIHGSALIEASFKLPIFMPAQTTLGYECQDEPENNQTLVNFELRDKQKGLPHIKGRLLKNK